MAVFLTRQRAHKQRQQQAEKRGLLERGTNGALVSDLVTEDGPEESPRQRRRTGWDRSLPGDECAPRQSCV